MKKNLLTQSGFALLSLFVLASCHKNNTDEPTPIVDPKESVGEVTYIFYAQSNAAIQQGVWENVMELAAACTDNSSRAYVAFNQATGTTPSYYQSIFYNGEKVSIIPDSLVGKNPQMWTTSYFTQVLNDAKSRLPARKYILVLSGHGDGYTLFGDGKFPIVSKTVPQGMTSMPGLALAQIKEGIQNSTLAPDELQMIYFDACLMSGVEYAAELAGVAQYMLANTTTTPGSGGSYQNLVNLLRGHTQSGNADFEAQMKSYMNDLVSQSGAVGWNNYYSQNSMISLTRLYNMPAVTSALGAYMTAFTNYRNTLLPESMEQLDTLILQSTFNYSLNLTDVTSSGTADAFYPVYDVGSCLASINNLTGNAAFTPLYTTFMARLNDAIVYSARTPTFKQNTSSKYWVSGYGNNVIQTGVPYTMSVSLIWSGAYTKYAPNSPTNYGTLQVCRVGNLNLWLDQFYGADPRFIFPE